MQLEVKEILSNKYELSIVFFSFQFIGFSRGLFQLRTYSINSDDDF